MIRWYKDRHYPCTHSEPERVLCGETAGKWHLLCPACQSKEWSDMVRQIEDKGYCKETREAEWYPKHEPYDYASRTVMQCGSEVGNQIRLCDACAVKYGYKW